MMSLSIPPFQSAHLLIIGDVMLDRYWYGNTSRISPEAPVPVVHVQQQEERPGGAGNVAFNINALGAKVTLISLVGMDEAAQRLVALLSAQGINCAFISVAEVPTITKLRVLSRHQQLLRLDFEQSFAHVDKQHLLMQVRHALATTIDVVILSDYGKGVIADSANIIQLARAAQKPILVDPKGQDFNKYRGATMITPNLAEFEAVVGACATLQQLEVKGEQLRQHLALQALLITRSQDGMTLLQQNHSPLHLPAQAREVYDVTGAGDTVIGVLAASLAAGLDMEAATRLANLAAGLVVAKLGTAVISVTELEQALPLHTNNKVHKRDSLLKQITAAKARGETVVMTNGCFDILHAGHVQYLTQARRLGNRLIVAVNDDASVQRLKGAQRPFNTLTQRLAVLAALECIDWLIPFSEDTPRNLICQLLPQILVKGSDYSIHDIAGSDCVLAHGGQVLTLDLLAGCSTTATLAAMHHANLEGAML
jgi:D-beta-D-heptose 7-phosphate kinase/D-beta-D-heptose 1-phosphate adenosyltransferase